MYKKLLLESEMKNQARLRDIQNGFKIEIKKLLDEKEQDAKYAQSEKELLENRIAEIEEVLEDLKNKYDHQGKEYDNLRNDKQKLDIMYSNSCQNLADLESKRNIEGEDAKRRQDDLHKKLFTNEVNHKKQMEDLANSKNK